MVYKSLTEAPHNLKEGIDWLMAVKGTDGEKHLKAMAAAVHHLFSDISARFKKSSSFKEIKSITEGFLQKPEIKDDWLVKTLLRRFYTPDSTENTGFRPYWHKHYDEYGRVVRVKGTKPEFIEECLSNVMDGFEKLLDDIKNPDEYKSAYSSKATWEASCAKDPEACAMVLVGIAPMLYAGLQSLRTTAEFKVGPFHKHTSRKNLGDVLRALGYVEPECRSGMNGSYIYETFRGLDKDLIHNTYDLAGFDIFYASKKAAVKSGKLDKDAQEMIDFYVNMKPINPPKKYVLRKPPSTYTATGSNNMYYPWLPTVLDMGDTVPL
ncbi:hypothetical protein BBBOND_0404430 [Babesia bigemina]|uniref:Uncharacterized protein n=1 Tax=Babesia bigemina TaxID=5866 RepID=A0A061DEV8_BABBI|nr:hypothetical protein BBBOND_0404430 [Babesia bigemina]CDR97955.1 hypothetical protein BBBOND_0404430 [Babesia bigemina]|eukprot:XP_012770141.1 hypothetical protein BBBOND_0404430 [Babesia bigemina]